MRSFSFRVIPSHPDDVDKPCVRIGKDQMKRLGISSGEVVLVTGITSTTAICLPLDDMILPHDPEFEYLNVNNKRLPFVRLSDVVLHGVRRHSMLSIVHIEKTKAQQEPDLVKHIPRLSGLRKTIQIGKKTSNKRLGITLESLSVYDNCFRLFLDIGYKFDDPEQWVENKLYAIVSAHDDIGNQYTCIHLRNDGSQWSIGNPQHIKLSCIMVPQINENATRLVFHIEEVTWSIREKRDLQFLDQINSAIKEEQSIVSVWQPQKLFYMIAAGPWSFDVDLE